MLRLARLPSRALVALWLALACSPAREPRPSFLLVTLDTTNPEALGCYGGASAATPNLDRLAREGVVFDGARAVAPLTLPAHASLMTGLYPPRHAVRRNGEASLAGEAITLAERASAQGYASAAFVSAVVLAPEFGLAQGFEHYDAPPVPADVEEHLAASRGASETAALALRWLAGRDRARPFFLWLHFYDPHFPYDPPAGPRARAGGDAYLGEVAAMDEALGTVLDALEREALLERTLVVALADHGEGLGRHEEETHGAFVFDTTLRIPMLARLPGAARAGERVGASVSQVDVVPLVAGVLGWERPGELDGRDPLASQGSPGVYFESYFGARAFGWSPLAGWTDGRLKYVHSSTPELFDLGADALETRSILGERAGEAAALRERIAELCARPRLARAPVGPGAGDLQREIELLGYAGALDAPEELEPEPLAATTAPSPHRMTSAYAEYMQGRKLFEEKGSLALAIEHLERAVAANPGNHKAWFTLGRARQALQRFDLAAEAFRRVLATPCGEAIPARLNLGVCLHSLGKKDEALRELESALAESDGPPGALELLVRLLEEAGRGEDARRARGRLARREVP